MLFSLALNAQKESSYAQKGLIDLSMYDLKNNIVTLDGEWEFYWEQLLSPGDFLDSAVTYGEIPQFWKNYPESFSRFGYATYRLQFVLSQEQQLLNLGLRLNNVHNSYKLWLNGELLIKNGEVGDSYDNSLPMWLPVSVALKNIKGTNELILQVSNYRHRNGGVQDPIEIGQYDAFEIVARHQIASELFLAGGCFILGSFFIGMFFFWRKDKAALHFGLFTLFFASRVLLVGSRPLTATFPDISWDFCIRLEYIGMFAMHFFMFNFILNAFPQQTSRKYALVLKWITIFFISICFLPGDAFTFLTIPNNYFFIVSFGYLIYVFAKALQAKVPGAIWAVLSMVIFFFTTIPVILEYSNLFITDPVILSLCYMGFMLSMSLVFASRFGKSFVYLETLTEMEKRKTEEISLQKASIERRNRMINDSINYAERIQSSLLPSESKLKTYFKNCFLFFKPQSTVSGDFYWAYPTEDPNESFVAVADCTGHGVPGAFVSLIAINTLDNIVSHDARISTASILTQLNEVIHNRLQKNDGDLAFVKDGLDIIVCKVNLNKKTILFSSAHHKLIVIRCNGEEEVYNGSKHHIGAAFHADFTFEEHFVQLQTGDQVYMLTDGVYDQKGGIEGKKLYLQRVRELFGNVSDFPMEEQKKLIATYLEEWKENREQLDDMLVFSIKF